MDRLGQKKEIKSFLGNIKRGKRMETGMVFILMGKRNNEGKYELGFQTGKWNYYDLNRKEKTLKENYF